ncbi:unnamed protein product, partial [Pylaiella littoralis]
QTIAASTGHLYRDAAQAAAQAIARRFCAHGSVPVTPLPNIANLKERKAAAQQHPGLWGVHHHTEYIGGVSYTAA